MYRPRFVSLLPHEHQRSEIPNPKEEAGGPRELLQFAIDSALVISTNHRATLCDFQQPCFVERVLPGNLCKRL